jgi:hypothetical protein
MLMLVSLHKCEESGQCGRMRNLSDLPSSASMFLIGIVSRCYYWVFALLMDPLDIYNRFLRKETWPQFEPSVMWFWIVLSLSIVWTAILTFHELRMRTEPHSGNEADLRGDFLEFLRRSMLPAFAAAHNFAVFFAMIEAKKHQDFDEKREAMSSIIVRCSPSMVPLLDAVDKQYASIFSLAELERIFLSAYENYNSAAINLQYMTVRFSPEVEADKTKFELKRDSFVAQNKKMREQIESMGKAGKFKILKTGNNGPFFGSQFSQYHLIAKYQRDAAELGSEQ